MKTTILHNTHCSKSRAGVAYLTDKKLDFEIRDLIKNPLTTAELEDVLSKLGMKAEELIRKNDAFFKENFGNKVLTENDYLKIMQENPRLIERPIVIRGNHAVIGRPTENIDKVLEE